MLLAAPSALAACAGSPYAIGKKFERLGNYTGQPSGLLLGSVGAWKAWTLSSAGLVFRQIGTEDLGKIDYTPKVWGAPKSDFETAKLAGYLYARTLPPGDYEIYGKEGYAVAGNMTSTLTTPVPVRRFTVRESEITYVGRIIFDSYRKGWAGPTEAIGAIGDEQAADLALLKARGGPWAANGIKITPALPDTPRF
ncbi:MAG TPA: hypothetical protein VIN58_25260 [Roseateles sp.]